MAENKSYFADSEAYELSIGRWSRLVGEIFLDWLALPAGLRWLDVGCGTGSFTELVLDRNAPSSISAIDPSEGQIAYARERPQASRVDYRQGDAMSLPYGGDEFDVAVMALVVQYVPDPPKAMSEIYRVVKQGGTVAAYVWDVSAGGHPQQPMNEALKLMGAEQRLPPSGHLRSIDALTDLFGTSGLEDIDSRTIQIQLDFKTFDEYWASQSGAVLTRITEKLTDADIERLKSSVRERLVTNQGNQISYMAGANAVRGIVRK